MHTGLLAPHILSSLATNLCTKFSREVLGCTAGMWAYRAAQNGVQQPGIVVLFHASELHKPVLQISQAAASRATVPAQHCLLLVALHRAGLSALSTAQQLRTLYDPRISIAPASGLP